MNWIEFIPYGDGLFELSVNGKVCRLLAEDYHIVYTEKLIEPFIDLDPNYFRMVAIGATRIAMSTPLEIINESTTKSGES